MNSERTCLFHKRFCTLYFEAKEDNAVTFPHNAQRKHLFLGKIKQMSKKKKLPSRKKISLDLLHQRLGHRSTKSLLAGDAANSWEDIYIRIDPDPFCTSCQIYSMKKMLGLKFHSSQRHPSSEFYEHNSINIIQKFDKRHNLF